MAGGAQLSVTDLRRSTRHPVDFRVIGEHLSHGDMDMRVVNISAHGFMIDPRADVARGDRVIVRLPTIGRIESYCIWVTEQRAGFQFERIIRLDDFMSMIGEIQPNPALRRRG